MQGLDGSVSAEHGNGLKKKPFLARSRSEAEIALPSTSKQALVTRGVLDPGRIVN